MRTSSPDVNVPEPAVPTPALIEVVPAAAKPEMPPPRSHGAQLWLGTAVAALIAIGWFLLAISHPTTTYHVDPFLVVIAPVALMRFRNTGPLPWGLVLAGSGIGAGFALTTTALLYGAGALRGPGLIGPISPEAEVLIAILLGVVVEVVFTLVRQVNKSRGQGD